MTYRKGDRVALVHTSDPHTRLTPGTQGTVTGYDPRLQQLHVAWDDGSTLSMLPGDGDQVRPAHPDPLPPPAATAPMPGPGTLTSNDGQRVIEVIERPDGSYHVVVTTSTGRVLADRFPATEERMWAVVQAWAY